MAAFLEQWNAFEKFFDGVAVTDWFNLHAELPIAAVALYLLFIFTVPEVLQEPFHLKHTFAVWNLFLSVFSVVGVSKIVPHLISTLMSKGYVYTVCEHPSKWYSGGPSGLWMMIFILSKFPELGDTAFLVLRKKPVIFLHWFHHTTVLLYCWHAGVVLAAPGLWFAAMNLSVHSIMYFYFFMTNIGYFKLMQPLAPFITTIQILQMAGGITCLVTVAAIQLTGGYNRCNVNPANWKLGLMMYASYFILFGWLFLQKYLPKNQKAIKREKSRVKPAAEVAGALERAISKHLHESTGEDKAEDIQAELDALDAQKEELLERLAQASKKAN